MLLDEAKLRRAIADVLLRSAGLPTMEDAEEYLSKAPAKADILVAYRGGEWLEAALRLLKPAVDRGAAKVRKARASEWPGGRPEPLISVGGLLGHRLQFYGLPDDILQPVFLLAVAAAAGGWRPGSCRGLEGVKGKLVAYLVPGLPCVRTLYNIIPVLLCNSDASVEAVNVETMIVQGMRPPVDRVPAFEKQGRIVKTVPRSPVEAARLWQTL